VVFQVFARLASRAAAHVVRTELSGQSLKRRTGALARALVGVAVMVRGVPGMRLGVFRGPAVAYAGIQERGGRILPKNARALAIPVGDALTPAGVSRYGSPRNYPGALKFLPARGSKPNVVGILYDPFRDLRALYILLKWVDLPARHYLRNGMRTFVPLIASELVTYISRAALGRRTDTNT
jgi:hypothetical protein